MNLETVSGWAAAQSASKTMPSMIRVEDAVVSKTMTDWWILGLGEVRFPGSGDIDLTGKESLGSIIRGIEHNQVIEDLLLVGGAEVGFLDKPGNQSFGLGERGYSDAGIRQVEISAKFVLAMIPSPP